MMWRALRTATSPRSVPLRCGLYYATAPCGVSLCRSNPSYVCILIKTGKGMEIAAIPR